jgi:hypothetical protein
MFRTITQAQCVSWILIPVMLWSYEWSLVDAASHRIPGVAIRQGTHAHGVAPLPAPEELRFDALLSDLKAVVRQAQGTSTVEARAARPATAAPLEQPGFFGENAKFRAVVQ